MKDSIQSYVYAQLLTSDYINATQPRIRPSAGSWLYNPSVNGDYILQDGDY